MKHYFQPVSRAVTTDWMLKELDAPHEQVVVPAPAGAQPEYRSINPMGKVPALVDGDVVITETAAICAYLADKFPEKALAPPLDSTQRGAYYRYLFFPGTTLEPLLFFAQQDIEADPGSVGWGDMQRGMASVESMTPAADWALGANFSAADVVFGGALAFFSGFQMMEASPRVAAYVERLKARPAYVASHAGLP